MTDDQPTTVFLVWAGFSDLLGVYATREAAELEAEAERRERIADGLGENPARVVVAEVVPRTEPRPRIGLSAEPPPWDELTPDEQAIARRAGRGPENTP